ncbi:adenylyltransferase/cytidyltransferase family protein [Arenibaculum sp.]|uniref:adenylyltransferase/cytidyltransferase family protein n=1 Tax=Arenibaculum sp. TaxID=2865862 RepID=UPI002E104E3F|nr:adenylyltransferase/cytidyltransferase family protein [Arenibaculum sp.]
MTGPVTGPAPAARGPQPGERPVVLTFGTFDLFHIGHLRIIERAASLGRLVVGVSSDELNRRKKGRYPIYSQDERMAIVASLACVEGVFLEEALERKREYLLRHGADMLVMGDDWQGRFDEFSDICRVLYLPRTPDVSTTSLIETIRALSHRP